MTAKKVLESLQDSWVLTWAVDGNEILLAPGREIHSRVQWEVK